MSLRIMDDRAPMDELSDTFSVNVELYLFHICSGKDKFSRSCWICPFPYSVKMLSLTESTTALRYTRLSAMLSTSRASRPYKISTAHKRLSYLYSSSEILWSSRHMEICRRYIWRSSTDARFSENRHNV